MLAFFALFLGICVLNSKARDSANIWGGSRVLLVTDLRNATVNVEKLYTYLADRGLADVFSRLLIVQRGHDGHFIKSHGSFRALSRVQNRTLWSISNKEILPWLLKEEANTIICLADSRADVPHTLISAQRKGMFPLDTKLMIWMIQDDVMAADGMNMISLILPEDFDPSYTPRKVRSISVRNLESAVIELFQRLKGNAHHRERRNAPSLSTSTTVSQSLSSSVSQFVYSSMITKVSVSSAIPAVGQSLTKISSSSPAVTQSVSSSMTTKVPIPSSSSSVTQSVSSPMTTKIEASSSSLAFVQSVSSSMTTKVSIPSSSAAAGQSVSSSLIVAPSSSATTPPVVSSAAGQFTSVPLTTKVTAPTATLTVSPSMSSSVAVRPTESAASTVSKSRSSPMVVSSFTETQATTVTVPIKPSSSVASLLTSSIPALSSSAVPSETLGPPSMSSQKSLVATTLQPTVSTSLPVISTPFPRSRSVETSSTPLRLFSSSVTSGSTSLPTSAVILPTSTKREPPPSSSSTVVTEKPPVYKNETIIMEFDGNCKDVVGIKKTEERFKQAFVSEVAGKLGIQEKDISVNGIACGQSIRVTFTITGTSGKANVSQVLKKLVDNGNISVTVDNNTFKASKLEVVQPTTPSTLAPTTKGKKNEIAFILYITFGALMAAIFIVGFIVLVARCRRDRREGSFFITRDHDANYELRRFQGIPRANSHYSRVNFYGEPVVKDAAAADPDADDEFQAGAGAYPYDVAPTGGHAPASTRSDAKEEKFNVGGMGMPEWKNLPKLSVKEVTVAEPSEDIPKSSGSVGSKQLLLNDETPPEDSRHAYDNPVLTFGDDPTAPEKEDS